MRDFLAYAALIGGQCGWIWLLHWTEKRAKAEAQTLLHERDRARTETKALTEFINGEGWLVALSWEPLVPVADGEAKLTATYARNDGTIQ